MTGRAVEHSGLVLPNPKSIPTYYPRVEVTKPFQEGIKQLGDCSAFLYGSGAAGEYPSAFLRRDQGGSNEFDLILVYRNSRKIYQQMCERKGRGVGFDVGPPKNPDWHHFWNSRAGMSCHRGRLLIDGELRPAKIVVATAGNINHHLFGRKHPWEIQSTKLSDPALHLEPDRFEKAMMIPVKRSSDPALNATFDLAVNAARINAIWFTLGRMKPEFSYKDFLEEYVQKSYRADVRGLFGIDVARKPKAQIAANPIEYDQMLKPWLLEFAKNGFIENLGDNLYRVNIAPDKGEITEWLVKAKMRTLAAVLEYWFINRGAGDGFMYFLEKLFRGNPILKRATSRLNYFGEKAAETVAVWGF